MKILTSEYKYKNKTDFEMLISAIQNEIERGNLKKYIDKSWRSDRSKEWSGEYISLTEEKIYRLSGSNYTSTIGEENYEGTWETMRSESKVGDKSIFESKYKIRGSGIGMFIDLFFKIEYLAGEKTIINIDWSSEDLFYDKPHSSLIKSATEFGIVSAFEDNSKITGKFEIFIQRILYHHIDSSFSLLNFAANRNIKRALFLEHEDENPKIENGFEIRRFRPNFTIGRLNNNE